MLVQRGEQDGVLTFLQKKLEEQKKSNTTCISKDKACCYVLALPAKATSQTQGKYQNRYWYSTSQTNQR